MYRFYFSDKHRMKDKNTMFKSREQAIKWRDNFTELPKNNVLFKDLTTNDGVAQFGKQIIFFLFFVLVFQKKQIARSDLQNKVKK